MMFRLIGAAVSLFSGVAVAMPNCFEPYGNHYNLALMVGEAETHMPPPVGVKQVTYRAGEATADPVVFDFSRDGMLVRRMRRGVVSEYRHGSAGITITTGDVVSRLRREDDSVSIYVGQPAAGESPVDFVGWEPSKCELRTLLNGLVLNARGQPILKTGAVAAQWFYDAKGSLIAVEATMKVAPNLMTDGGPQTYEFAAQVKETRNERGDWVSRDYSSDGVISTESRKIIYY